jgi:hypothetical protein
MSKPDLKWQRDTALRHIEQLRAELKGQSATDKYLADKAARYVGTTAAKVIEWMKGRP